MCSRPVYTAVQLKSSQSIFHEPQVDGHELGHKCLEMVDGLASLVQSMFIVGSPLSHLVLQLPVTVLDEFLHESNEYDFCRNAVAQKLIQASTDLKYNMMTAYTFRKFYK